MSKSASCRSRKKIVEFEVHWVRAGVDVPLQWGGAAVERQHDGEVNWVRPRAHGHRAAADTATATDEAQQAFTTHSSLTESIATSSTAVAIQPVIICGGEDRIVVSRGACADLPRLGQ
eukprot:CAMPEP_0171642868 /NCGR_PEP_ID=MMETSP0990-20121206/32269_1 /TAXON_ID=483369 /ORGANISM="non described non described, Strain CCMP2098" /LENGTH=117 /DNA_ID=CAMNT_0012218287 /DNA_START=117 /DNA_END=470 /DNA_ORIENTATION=-